MNLLAFDTSTDMLSIAVQAGGEHIGGAGVEQSGNAIEAGASGFLIKQTSSHEVCRAIREVHQGKKFFSPTVARRMQQIESHKPHHAAPPTGKSPSLTSREMETLQLIAEGRANKEIAAQLGIGMKTVEKHREHLMKKLDLHDTAGITRYAISAGIIESSVQVTIL